MSNKVDLVCEFLACVIRCVSLWLQLPLSVRLLFVRSGAWFLVLVLLFAVRCVRVAPQQFPVAPRAM